MSDKIQFGKNGLWTAVYTIPLICDWILATRANFFSLMLVLVLSVTEAHAAERQTLHGHVPAAVGDFHLQPVGRLPAQERLSLVIGLPLRNREEFNNLLQQIDDPSSPHYRRYLTPQQIAERFGPTEQDYRPLSPSRKRTVWR